MFEFKIRESSTALSLRVIGSIVGFLSIAAAFCGAPNGFVLFLFGCTTVIGTAVWANILDDVHKTKQSAVIIAKIIAKANGVSIKEYPADIPERPH